MINIENKFLQGYSFIDLFCGIGGFHLALESFGAACVFASDIDARAQEVYCNNFDIMPSGDINNISVDSIPPHDILCGGFPCQPFSISGTQKGFNDEQGRGKLFFRIVEIAQHHKPRVILLENVKNFKKHDNGKTLKRVYSELNSIGYKVYDDILCASDFNIPQARKRIYIIAFRNDLNVNEFQFPKELDEFKVLNDILITNNEIPGNYVVNRDYVITEIQQVERTKELRRIGRIGLGRQGERIYSTNGSSITLSSQGGGLGGKTGMYVIDGQLRKLYPRECARLMGFPDTFKLAKSQEACYNQFGNSVVVDVLQHILIKIEDKIRR